MNGYRMKGNQVATDVRLGRVPSFDERSRKFPIRALLDRALRPRSYTWRLGIHLDQDGTPACTGFSTAHELAARPVVVQHVDAVLAMSLYMRARQLDEWPGEDYDGSSVLGAMKAAAAGGYYEEYRWAFGLDDLIMAVGHHGPAVLGVNWYTGMMSTDEEGFVSVAGRVEGGHAILCNGVSVKHEKFFLANSWGLDWGIGGGCWVTFGAMNRLLGEDGEAAVPVKRMRG